MKIILIKFKIFQTRLDITFDLQANKPNFIDFEMPSFHLVIKF